MRSILAWAALAFACAAAITPGRADAKTLSGIVFDDRNGAKIDMLSSDRVAVGFNEKQPT